MSLPQQLQVRMHHMWPGFPSPPPTAWIDFFRDLLGPTLKDTPFTEVWAYAIHPLTPPPAESIPPHVLTVHFTGEPCFLPPERGGYHVYLVPSDLPHPRAVVFSLSHFNIFVDDCSTRKRLITPRPAAPPAQHFACTVVSNAHYAHRGPLIAAFAKIAARHGRRVDSAGQHMNTVGYLAPKGSNYEPWIGNFRWMLCMENTNQPYYITEKILNAYLGGAVPIYWGCAQVVQVFNTAAFLWIPPDAGPEAVAAVFERAIDIDSNPVAYATMRTQPLLSDDEPVYRMDSIQKKIRDIIEGLVEAKSDGSGRAGQEGKTDDDLEECPTVQESIGNKS